MMSECHVARDLMPLVIDGVASEESQGLVQAHLESCGDCAQVYADMQEALTQQRLVEKEKRDMETIAAQLRRTRIRKGIIAGLVGLVCAVLLCLGVYYADEIAFRMEYVHWNGDLREEALFAKVSRFPTQEFVRFVHLTSSPCGSPDFDFEYEAEILEDGASLCLQVRAKYRGWNTDEGDSGLVFGWGYEQDGVWIGYSGEEYGDLPITRIELLCGDNATVLWELGDEVPTQQEVNQEEQAILENRPNRPVK